MYNPPSPRKRYWRKFILLAFMWVVVISGVVILTALTLGYSFNKDDGHIEQGGILQMNSQPSGATITINDTQFGSQTPAKLVSQPGDFTVKMERQGYRPWQKTIPIQSGNITWIAYPKLIPEKLSPEPVLELPATLANGLSSSTSRYYALLNKPEAPELTIATIGTDKVESTNVTIPSTIISTSPHEADAETHRYELSLWSGDDQWLLVKHTYGTKLEWLLINPTKPESSINLNKTLGVEPTKVLFGSSNGRQLYGLIDGSVKLLDLSAQVVSKPYVNDVEDFQLYDGETILFITKPIDGHQSVGYAKKDFKQPAIVKKVPFTGTSTLFDMSRYYDKYNVFIGSGKDATLYQLNSMPSNFEKSPPKLVKLASLSLPQNITHLNLTGNGQFATIQDGTSFATYNLEVKQQATTQFTSEGTPPQKLQYLDTYLYWGVKEGKLRTVEFDGTNQNDIMPSDSRFDATFSPTGKYLYGVAKKADGNFVLQRVQLLDLP